MPFRRPFCFVKRINKSISNADGQGSMAAGVALLEVMWAGMPNVTKNLSDDFLKPLRRQGRRVVF
jgi:hypothetical protein